MFLTSQEGSTFKNSTKRDLIGCSLDIFIKFYGQVINPIQIWWICNVEWPIQELIEKLKKLKGKKR